MAKRGGWSNFNLFDHANCTVSDNVHERSTEGLASCMNYTQGSKIHLNALIPNLNHRKVIYCYCIFKCIL